jgi:plasmid stabilization system protein ParE
MPRGDKSAYSDRQKRKAEHIAEGYEESGVRKKEAKRRAWATVNKDESGGKQSGSGRGKKATNAASKKGGRIGGKKAAASRKRKNAAARKGGKAAARKKAKKKS